MIQTIIACVISCLVSAIFGFLTGKLKSLSETHQDQKQEFKTQKEALKCLLRANIVSQYYVYRKLGHIPYYVRESVCEEYKAYKSLGGNSFVESIMQEIRELKIEE